MTDNTIDTSNLKAGLTPYSSVVGTSIALVSKDGPIVALLMVSVPNPQFDYKATALPIAKEIVELWNTRARLAELEAEIAKLRAQITDPRTVTITRTRYEEYQAAEERLAAYEGQITAEEMREKCAIEVWSFLNNCLICDDAQTVLEDEAAVAIRALSTKREEG